MGSNQWPLTWASMVWGHWVFAGFLTPLHIPEWRGVGWRQQPWRHLYKDQIFRCQLALWLPFTVHTSIYTVIYMKSKSSPSWHTGVYCVMSSPSPSTTGCKQEKLTVQSRSPELKFLVALIQSLCPPHTFFSFSQSKLLWLGLARTNEFHKFWIKTGQKLCMAPKYQKEKKVDIYITKTVQEHMWKKTAKV